VDYINEAIRTGRILPEREAHYRRLFAINPEGTKRVLARLHPVPGLASLEQPANSTRGPIGSDAGRRIAAGSMGGYVLEEV
jgi:hypothetical protein